MMFFFQNNTGAQRRIVLLAEDKEQAWYNLSEFLKIEKKEVKKDWDILICTSAPMYLNP